MNDLAPRPIPILASIEPVGAERRAWLVDLWGVMHNGVTPFTGATAACRRFRASGGIVVFLSNAPRPWLSVAAQLERLGVPADSYDSIVTSGDASRPLILESGLPRIFHLGPERDLGLYSDLKGVAITDLGAAELIVCTGLFDDERDKPDDYREFLAMCVDRQIPMICANPDLAVVRGEKVIPCAGAVAQVYEHLGGDVTYAGKPHLPVYTLAMDAIEGLGGVIAQNDILAIGDGVATDIAGASAAGIPAVYVASGVHMADGEALSAETLDKLFPRAEMRPVAAIAELVW